MTELDRTGREADPRIERSRRVVRRAALRELSASGLGGFTIESVAARAGVGRSTVYRHWNGKLDLIADALETLNEQPSPRSDGDGGGSARDGVEIILRHLAENLADPEFSAFLPALVEGAERDAAVREFHVQYAARRRRRLTETIRSGVDSGELSSALDPEMASLALAGALFYRRLVACDPLDPERVPDLVDAVLGQRRERPGGG